MCTLSVLRLNGFSLVTMNRDDLVERPEAPPDLLSQDDAAIIAPKDLKAGGTWIGVNQHGLVSCLLNRYDQGAPQNGKSRGEIVPRLLRRTNDSKQAAHQIRSLALECYAPFTCVVLSQMDACRIDWTGTSLLIEDLPAQSSWMITSSSVRETEVRSKRARLFEALLGDGEKAINQLAKFHAHSTSDDAWWSPWMERPSAHTKSITQVALTAQNSQMRYWDRGSILAAGLVNAPYVMDLLRHSDPLLA